jgi:hypothetical protein
MVPEGPRAISMMERLTQRQLGPVARQLVTLAQDLRVDPARA